MKSPYLTTYPYALTLLALLVGSKAFAANVWNYQQETDRLSNQSYSYALSPLPRRDLYDELRLEVVCRNKQLQVTLTADELIASQGSKFDISYQIDQSPPVALQMTTFPDSKRKGYTDSQAQQIINALLTGKDTIFLRVSTLTRKELAGAITLDGMMPIVQKVLGDCSGMTDKPAAANYDFKAFQQDFDKLSVGQQKQLLSQIKLLLDNAR
ncbi:MAG: hypothetical protein PHU14_00540 [Methylovulum sp.]|nr:hypothetical protein [Methylovulum sp.]